MTRVLDPNASKAKTQQAIMRTFKQAREAEIDQSLKRANEKPLLPAIDMPGDRAVEWSSN